MRYCIPMISSSSMVEHMILWCKRNMKGEWMYRRKLGKGEQLIEIHFDSKQDIISFMHEFKSQM